MRRNRNFRSSVPSRRRQSGSAMLVSLMVMVGLSLLGLAFVTISETESAISVNERNAMQTLAVAETGARTVVEWFNAPKWALANDLMPLNDAAIKQERKAQDAANFTYTGYYKPDAPRLFDLPHKTASPDRFWGVDEKSADIVINATTLAASGDAKVQNFLNRFNELLFANTTDGAAVTDIRIYAPPVIGSPSTTEHPASSGKRFWDRGKRYGLATIKVTAQKRNPSNEVIAERFVKIVVAEFPFPGPEGPLQSNTGIALTGAFRVHWGKEVSIGNVDQKRAQDGIPWWNPYEQVHFEHGYNNIAYPSDAADPAKRKFLFDLIGKQFGDPWFQVRARQKITVDVPGATQPVDPNANSLYPYDSIHDKENGNDGEPDTGGWSSWFQNQDSNDYPTKKEVIFPRIDYTFWKQVATTGTASQGIYYLTWVSGTQFRDKNGTQKEFIDWVDTTAGAKAGFYFFDTRTAANPQNADGSTNTAILTPEISVNGDPCIRGFIFLNTVAVDLKISDGCAGYFAAPGEPFRDVGYHKVDEATGLLMLDGGGAPILENPRPEWDFQDLEIGGVKNKEFDYVVELKASITPDGADSGPLVNEYVIKQYYDGCPTIGVDCSEPHEPYLNLLYPWPFAQDGGGAGAPEPFTVRWEAGRGTRRPKTFQADEKTPVVCDANSSIDDCTSNAYDYLGAVMRLGSTNAMAPSLDGVLYNEGAFFANAGGIYYGSILVRGLAEKNGNPDIWFDERLVKGNWQERFVDLPRVLITTFETQ